MSDQQTYRVHGYCLVPCSAEVKVRASSEAEALEQAQAVFAQDRESSINATWQSVIEPEDFAFIIEQGGRTLFGIPLLFQRYACFMSALGENLGIEFDGI